VVGLAQAGLEEEIGWPTRIVIIGQRVGMEGASLLGFFLVYSSQEFFIF
jgi:hypothetical protein